MRCNCLHRTEPERCKVRWVCRGYGHIDHKEVMAQRDAIRSGLKTLSECIAENGGDVEELLVQRQSELQIRQDEYSDRF